MFPNELCNYNNVIIWELMCLWIIISFHYAHFHLDYSFLPFLCIRMYKNCNHRNIHKLQSTAYKTCPRCMVCSNERRRTAMMNMIMLMANEQHPAHPASLISFSQVPPVNLGHTALNSSRPTLLSPFWNTNKFTPARLSHNSLFKPLNLFHQISK